MPGELRGAWLGRVGYREAWALQESLRAAVIDGTGAETLLLLEHDPVITLGHSADAANVLVGAAELAARGVEVVRTSRGGDVTYHGPGQLVAYPVVRLGGVRSHVEAMAAAVIDVVAAWGIAGRWQADRAGVWVGEQKICAFGVHVHRRVAIHGLALNVTTPRSAFRAIVPCGLRDAGVTSIADESGATPTVREVATALAPALARRLARELRFDEAAGPPAAGALAAAGSRSPGNLPDTRLQ